MNTIARPTKTSTERKAVAIIKVCKVCGVEIAPRKTYCAECAKAVKRQSQQQSREREKALKPTVAPRGAAALAICNEDCFNCPWDDCRVGGTTPGTGYLDSQISRLNRGITLADVLAQKSAAVEAVTSAAARN